MATKPELNKAKAYEKIRANKYNENFDVLLDYIEDVSEELMLKVNTINSQLSSTILSNLQSVYPIGSLYIGVTDTCPIANLFGTWEKVSSGRVLQGADGSQEVGTTVEAGLPNITGDVQWTGNGRDVGNYSIKSGCFSGSYRGGYGNGDQYSNGYVINFDASKSNSIYKDDCDTVQPPAYLVNIWKRTA